MDNNLRLKIIARIKELRAEQNLTQKDFALMCGLNKNYMGQIENNEVNFGIDTLQKMIEGLGITPEEFFKERKS